MSKTLTGTPPALEIFHKIINIYELLENVLSHLSAKEIIRAQGISFQFKSVITSSLTLQQQLFLVPRADADPKQWLIVNDEVVDEDHSVPLYSVPLGTTIEDFYSQHRHLESSPENWISRPRTLNPLLFDAWFAADYAECVEEDP